MKTRILVSLIIEGDDAEDEATGVIDSILDAGLLQDAVNEYAEDRGLDLSITSVIVSEAPEE